MIQVEGLSVWYGPIPALQELSFEVGAGECVLVTGPSGCGKSTLGRALAGLVPHAFPARMEGRVHVAGIDTQEQTPANLAVKVGSVFQNPACQLFHLRVEDEIAFGPRNLRLAETEVQERVEWTLEALGLVELRQHRPTDLSGGQKQRVAIAAALAMRPSILVLDEPTASLDVPGTRSVLQALRHLKDDYGITIVLIEHRLVETIHLADRVMVMSQGRLLAQGEPMKVLADRDLLRQLGLRRPVDEHLVDWEKLLAPNGRPYGQPLGQCENEAVPLLEMRQVSAGYHRQAVIEEINLAIYPGEFLALVGDNGAGKSTLALTAAGLLKPKKGEVRFKQGRRPRPGLDIALLFQNPEDQLFNDTVEEEVAFGPLNYRLFHSSTHEETLQQADLTELRDRRLGALSMGQKQRVTLASCLALRPDLLILDEPTLGQDWGHLQRLMDFLSLLNQQGATILLITHDYKLVHRYTRRVVLIENGRIKLDGHLQDSQLGLETV